MPAGTYVVPDSRKKFVDRLKKNVRDSWARLEEVTAFADLANNTPVEIFVLNNRSQAQRLALPVGEAALLTIETIIKKTSDGSVTGEATRYTAKNVAGTITLAAVGSSATLVVPTGNSANQLVLTATAPTNAAYSVATHVTRLSALR